MKASIYLPVELEILVKDYLDDHPEMTLSSLVQEALESKLKPRRNRILELAGFVDSRNTIPRTPQEMVDDLRERPEDEIVKRGLDRL